MMNRIRHRFIILAAAALIATAGIAGAPRAAHAWIQECVFCACIAVATPGMITTATAEHPPLQTEIMAGWADLESWMVQTLYKEIMATTLAGAVAQHGATVMTQAAALGSMMDAQQQIKSQTLMSRMAASAHKDYKTSTAMCTMGTAARSLASSHAKADLTAATLSRRALDRQTGTVGGSAQSGPGWDRENRFNQFAARFCNPMDNAPAAQKDTGLRLICKTATESVNADIDFMGSVMSRRTIPADFEGGNATPAGAGVLALSANLYAHDLTQGLSSAAMNYSENIDEFMDLRSVIAKRSVAQNSYNAIVGMKAPGSADTGGNIRAILTELGVPQAEIAAYLGDDAAKGGRPGYLAQMEILAKKIYQSPSFYVGLYESPANLKRRSVAMQAIKSMLGRDIQESYLRSEAILAVLLETRLTGDQTVAEGRIAGARP